MISLVQWLLDNLQKWAQLWNVTLWLLLSRGRIFNPWILARLMTCFSQENKAEVVTCPSELRPQKVLYVSAWSPGTPSMWTILPQEQRPHKAERKWFSIDLPKSAGSPHICLPPAKPAVTADEWVNPAEPRRTIQLSPAPTADPWNCDLNKWLLF